MTAREIIDIYISFFEEKPRNHKRIPNSPLVPENDPTTLFTSSGMQPLIQFLLGEKHSQGTRLVNVQNSFRAQDIDEVGDNRHTTFFRMLGNWSLGDYFKEDEIPWLWEFLTKRLGLSKDKLYVTVFDGDKNFKVIKNEKHQPLTPDVESKSIWTNVFKDADIDPEEKIFFLGAEHNWWSRSGKPEKMPIGEIGGPDTEVYFDFFPDQEKITQENFVKHADSGRLLEIANSVFMQYKKIDDETFEELPKKNVDFGAGLERLLTARNNDPDIFRIDSFKKIIDSLMQLSGLITDPSTTLPPEKYYPVGHEGKIIHELSEHDKFVEQGIRSTRIIADHMRSAVFIVATGIIPDNKGQGYILRRLIRRSMLRALDLGIQNEFTERVVKAIIESHSDTDPYLIDKQEEILKIIKNEEDKFSKTLKLGLKEFEKALIFGEVGKPETRVKILSPKDIFKLYETFGFPYELSAEEAKKRNIEIPSQHEFDMELEEHKNLSRNASVGMFKGGLADTSEQTVMGHTATHLLHQALRDVFGDKLHQSGSNITSERIRFDFNLDRGLTPEEIKEVEDIVNGKIKENLEVHFEIMPLQKAKDLGAIGLFDDKYEKDVKIYFIGNYSKEFCGGPHVDFTGKLKTFRIIKQDNLGRGMRRIYAKVG